MRLLFVLTIYLMALCLFVIEHRFEIYLAVTPIGAMR